MTFNETNGYTERIDPILRLEGNSKLTSMEHLKRYLFFTKHFIEPKDFVVDAACGCGYGTRIISYNSGKVIGLDISQEAIEYARKNHNAPNIDFILENLEDASQNSVKECSVDKVISFETIEHLKNPSTFLEKVYKMLKYDGLFIVSNPNANNLSIKGISPNPHHIREYSEKELTDLIVEKRFSPEEMYCQGPILGYLARFMRKIGVKRAVNKKTKGSYQKIRNQIIDRIPLFAEIFSQPVKFFRNSSMVIIAVNKKKKFF
jgi:2-polyprenyl-3-methyl-5-hydroxy-6-metoxy-1,4-benzoquinol methylase